MNMELSHCIPKNTLLFRSAPNISEYKTEELCLRNARKCQDTDKVGIYFGDRPILSIAMCLEYNKLLEIGVFIVLEDVEVSMDKYGFRHINPSRYFDENGNLILDIEPLQEENISHCDCDILPLKFNVITGEMESLLPESKMTEFDACEIFLAYNDIKKIKLLEGFEFNINKIENADDLFSYMEKNNYPLTLDKYIVDEVLLLKTTTNTLDAYYINNNNNNNNEEAPNFQPIINYYFPDESERLNLFRDINTMINQRHVNINEILIHDEEQGVSYPILYFFCVVGDTDMVKLLLSNNADPNYNQSNPKYTPLCIASKGNSTEICKLLIDAGSDLNVLDGRKYSPLFHAAYNKNIELVKYLVERGADVNFPGKNRSPMLGALFSDYNNIEVVKYLYEKEGCIFDRNWIVFTVYDPQYIIYFREKGLDFDGHDVLEYFLNIVNPDSDYINPAALDYFIQNDEIDLQSLFLIAVRRSRFHDVNTILSTGMVDINGNEPQSLDLIPLYVACHFDYFPNEDQVDFTLTLELINLLIEKGANKILTLTNGALIHLTELLNNRIEYITSTNYSNIAVDEEYVYFLNQVKSRLLMND
jgi:ankyrin repeat protein